MGFALGENNDRIAIRDLDDSSREHGCGCERRLTDPECEDYNSHRLMTPLAYRHRQSAHRQVKTIAPAAATEFIRQGLLANNS
jgi:hypothetical protein